MIKCYVLFLCAFIDISVYLYIYSSILIELLCIYLFWNSLTHLLFLSVFFFSGLERGLCAEEWAQPCFSHAFIAIFCRSVTLVQSSPLISVSWTAREAGLSHCSPARREKTPTTSDTAVGPEHWTPHLLTLNPQFYHISNTTSYFPPAELLSYIPSLPTGPSGRANQGRKQAGLCNSEPELLHPTNRRLCSPLPLRREAGIERPSEAPAICQLSAVAELSARSGRKGVCGCAGARSMCCRRQEEEEDGLLQGSWWGGGGGGRQLLPGEQSGVQVG